MDVAQKVLYFFIDLVLPLAVGYICRGQKNLPPSVFDTLITANIVLLFPVMAVLSFWQVTLRTDLLWLPVIGILMHAVPGLIAWPRAKTKYECSLDQGSYILSAMLSNSVTLGGLCAYIVYGETGFAYTQLTQLFGFVILFGFCFPLAQYYYSRHAQRENRPVAVKDILFSRNQLPVAGVIVGMILNHYGWERPGYFTQIFDFTVHASAWAALLPVGYSIDFSEMKKYWRGITDLLAVKFIITPLLVYLFAALVITDHIMLNTILILASTPTAINTVITVKIFNLNMSIAMSAFVLTTAVFLLCVFPVMFFWLS